MPGNLAKDFCATPDRSLHRKDRTARDVVDPEVGRRGGHNCCRVALAFGQCGVAILTEADVSADRGLTPATKLADSPTAQTMLSALLTVLSSFTIALRKQKFPID